MMATNANPCMVAHRGGSRAAPESTMAAFEAALAANAGVIEFDIGFDSANKPVIIHDSTLGRTTQTSGNVAEYGVEQLRVLDAGSSYAPYFAKQGVPSLAEVLNDFGGKITMQIEIKGAANGGTTADAENIVADMIHQYGLEAYTIISNQLGYLGGHAWAAYGIPGMQITGTIAADGTVRGISAASWFSSGYRYLALKIGSANFDAGAAVWAELGASVEAWTAMCRYDRDLALACPDVSSICCSDPAYIMGGYDLPAGVIHTFDSPSLPVGVIPFYPSEGIRAENMQPADRGLVSGIGGVGGGAIGWPLYGAIAFTECLVLGRMRAGVDPTYGWGVGALSATMKYEAAAADTTRWGGIGWYIDDRGHCTGCGADGSTGYFGALRANGRVELYEVAPDGTETQLAHDDSGAALSVGSSYPLVLTMNTWNVVFTANGKTAATGVNIDYRGAGMVAALHRNRMACAFSSVVRTS